jgi:hypothetical protein
MSLSVHHRTHRTHRTQVYRWQEKKEMIRYRKERLLEPTVDLPPHLTYLAICHSPRSVRPNHRTAAPPHTRTTPCDTRVSRTTRDGQHATRQG